MTQEKMTVTRALAEIKSIKNRFSTQLNEAPMLMIALGKGENKKVVNSSMPVAQTEDWLKSKFQSLEGLLKRYKAIREQVILSNATTKVAIGKEEMTVAAAIERKTSIEMDQLLLRHMMAFQNKANNEVASAEARLTADIDRMLTQVYGSDRTKITEDQIKMISDQKRNDFEPSVIDPIGIPEKIDLYKEDIEQFLLEVNFVLSESNARTEITIEY